MVAPQPSKYYSLVPRKEIGGLPKAALGSTQFGKNNVKWQMDVVGKQ